MATDVAKLRTAVRRQTIPQLRIEIGIALPILRRVDFSQISNDELFDLTVRLRTLNNDSDIITDTLVVTEIEKEIKYLVETREALEGAEFKGASGNDGIDVEQLMEMSTFSNQVFNRMLVLWALYRLIDSESPMTFLWELLVRNERTNRGILLLYSYDEDVCMTTMTATPVMLLCDEESLEGSDSIKERDEDFLEEQFKPREDIFYIENFESLGVGDSETYDSISCMGELFNNNSVVNPNRSEDCDHTNKCVDSVVLGDTETDNNILCISDLYNHDSDVYPNNSGYFVQDHINNDDDDDADNIMLCLDDLCNHNCVVYLDNSGDCDENHNNEYLDSFILGDTETEKTLERITVSDLFNDNAVADPKYSEDCNEDHIHKYCDALEIETDEFMLRISKLFNNKSVVNPSGDSEEYHADKYFDSCVFEYVETDIIRTSISDLDDETDECRLCISNLGSNSKSVVNFAQSRNVSDDYIEEYFDILILYETVTDELMSSISDVDDSSDISANDLHAVTLNAFIANSQGDVCNKEQVQQNLNVCNTSSRKDVVKVRHEDASLKCCFEEVKLPKTNNFDNQESDLVYLRIEKLINEVLTSEEDSKPVTSEAYWIPDRFRDTG